MDIYNVLILVLFIAGWLAFVRYLLPKLGVPT